MDFQIPADIAALDDDALQSAIDDALEASAAYGDIPDAELTEEQATGLLGLGDFVTAARAEQESRKAAAEEAAKAAAARSEALSAARTALTPPAPAPEPAPAPVVASLVSQAAAKGGTATPPPPEKVLPRVSLVAAADVPGVPTGSALTSLAAAGAAVMARLNTYPRGDTGTPQRLRHGAVVARKDYGGLTQDNYRTDQELLAAAVSQARLRGGSLLASGSWQTPSDEMIRSAIQALTAAGAWEAPSPQDISMPVGPEQADGLLDLPEIGITRGGINYTKGVDFGDILGAGSGFWDLTEAQVEAGPTKTLLTPTAPSFTDVRLDAVGAGVKAGILTQVGWPELVQRYIAGALLAHQYKISAKLLAKIQTSTGAAVSIANGYGNATDILHALDLAAYGERQRRYASDTEVLEVLLPRWVRQVLRADLANRAGVDLLDVPDARVDAWFRQRYLRPQYLRQYQPVTIGGGGVATAWPATFEAIFYPAGTYVKGGAEVLTLDTIYDSTLLAGNENIVLWTEEGVLLANPEGIGKRISIALEINGQTSGGSITGNLFVAP